ncbi:MAG: DegT/DnrJ/EryC1/StrS family aminotransferase [Bdellovibrionaceae bacterium]|nr:DegT/DnrJ/EryC1/StrS family aminotransferase [Pseudobdellovibrionaceae bacterium]
MIDLRLATTTWDEKEIDAIQKVVKSGFYTMGEHVLRFEKDFADFFGSKFAIMVNSGSSANLIGISALFFTQNNPLKTNDEVIVPAVSWSTTYSPLFHNNLKLKFVDIDESTLNFDLNKLERAITDKTRIILAVNLLGNPNDFIRIKKIIGNRNIEIVEDNCESMGAKLEGKYTGTFGKFGTYSTFFSHHIATMEGGVVTTDDEELYHIMLCLRAHGWTRNLPLNNKLVEISDDPFKESFRFILPGYNLRPIELSGAIGIEQIKKLNSILNMRRKNAQEFQKLFCDSPYFQIQEEIGESSWFGFSLIIRDNADIMRENVIKRLVNEGVECRPIVAGDFTKNEVLKYYNYEIFEDLKNAEKLDKNGFFIGNHHYDIRDKLKKLNELLN